MECEFEYTNQTSEKPVKQKESNLLSEIADEKLRRLFEKQEETFEIKKKTAYN